MFLEVNKIVILKSTICGIRKDDNRSGKQYIILYVFSGEPIVLAYETAESRDLDYESLIKQFKEGTR